MNHVQALAEEPRDRSFLQRLMNPTVDQQEDDAGEPAKDITQQARNIFGQTARSR
jgi:hypothetical protein